MEDPGLEAGGREGALHQAMIAAGALDGDEAIAELVPLEGLADLDDGSVEGGSGVLDLGGREEDTAVEIGQQELGANLGTVEAEDAEVLGADLLDARMEDAPRLTDGAGSRTAGRRATGSSASHERSLPKKS
jgi:hypothetical protein